jgi:NAD(P)-dependent dehydrogenase (short-subunit alcohol dehydrogenase family)
MTTLLITGANRGIGFEHVRQALADEMSVIACCRDPAKADALKALLAQYGPETLRIEALEVTDAASIETLTQRLAGVPIDILINNAGVMGPASWGEVGGGQTLQGMDYDEWEKILRINLLSPFRMTAALLPNLLASQRKLVVMMSSELGSMSRNTMGGTHAYRSSKAALNMITRGLAVDLKAQGVSVIAMAPGWVKTDLGGANAHWEVADSVKHQRQVLATAGLEQSGQFISLTGEIMPW